MKQSYLFNLEVFQRHGYIAIDIYFLLSGFCLFYPIARNMFGEIKFTGWKEFFIKRVRRIYPVYVFLLIIAIIFPALSMNYSANNGLLYTAKHFFSHILFLNNFSSETLSSIIGTAWFLPVIVQFYIVFPLICKFFRKKPILTFLGMTVVAVLVRLTLLCNFDLGSQMSQAFMPEYLDVFGFGMLSAYFVVYAKHKIKHIYEMKFYMTLMSMICVLAAIGYFFWISNMHMPDGIYGGNMYFRTLYRGIFAMIVAIFMFTTCFSYDFWNKKIWGNKFFVFLSSISYAMFLCHQNICLFLKKINIPYTTANPVMDDRPAMEGLTLLCLIISIATSVILTKYVEQPICKYGYKGYFKNIKNRLFSFVCHNRVVNQKTKKISNYLIICGCIILTLSFIWNFTQQYPWSTNNFNSYILQVQSWLQGKLDVNNIEYLELAIFNKKYFVSFPPFPSYIMLPFVAIGWNNCDGFITIFFTLVGAIYAYKLASCFRESNIICIFWTLFLVIGSNTLFTAITPYVWFIAQNMCFSLLIISLYYAKKGNGKLSLIAWACAVGCRPLSLFYIFLITYLLYKNLKQKNPEKNIEIRN